MDLELAVLGECPDQLILARVKDGKAQVEHGLFLSTEHRVQGEGVLGQVEDPVHDPLDERVGARSRGIPENCL